MTIFTKVCGVYVHTAYEYYGSARTKGTKLETGGFPNVGEIDFSYVHFLQSENNPKPLKKIWPFPIRVN